MPQPAWGCCESQPLTSCQAALLLTIRAPAASPCTLLLAIHPSFAAQLPAPASLTEYSPLAESWGLHAAFSVTYAPAATAPMPAAPHTTCTAVEACTVAGAPAQIAFLGGAVGA